MYVSNSSGDQSSPVFLFLAGFALGYAFKSQDLLASFRVIMDAVVPAYTVLAVTVLNVLAFKQFQEERSIRMKKIRSKQQAKSQQTVGLRGAVPKSDDEGRGLFRSLNSVTGSLFTRKKQSAPGGSMVKKTKDKVASSKVAPLPPVYRPSPELKSAVPASITNTSGIVDLTGSYKLEKKINFQEFLACQGVGWAIRKAADKAVTVNHITHEGDSLRIRVQGIISSETTYMINGPPIETRIQSKVFRDSMTYLPTGDGVLVTKVNEEEGYRILVQRRLSTCKQTMSITSTAVFSDGKEVESTQIFQRI